MKTSILRNKLTGLFFNGTNFSEECANKAKRFQGELSETAIKHMWANAQILEITPEQIAKLDLSDELESRAKAHRESAKSINHPSVRAQREGASTRLFRRATKLATEVYSTFGHYGRTSCDGCMGRGVVGAMTPEGGDTIDCPFCN